MNPDNNHAKSKDPLFLAIVISTAMLTLVFSALFVLGSRWPTLAEIPLFVPMLHGFSVLATISIAFLALGRHRVLREPAASYWLGMAFASYSVLSVFYVLVWPGLRSDGLSIIGHLPGTPAWMISIALTAFGLFMVMAVVTRWPGQNALQGHRWGWSVVGWITLFALAGVAVVVFEQLLPTLVRPDGAFTSTLLAWYWALLILFAGGALVSIRDYRRSADKQTGRIALMQIVVAFSILGVSVAGRRYSLEWYASRLLCIGGYLSMLFGLLGEYVSLYRRERERASELQASIVERKRAEHEREIAVEFLRLVNESQGTRDLVQKAVTYFQEQSSCQAVGIRIRDGHDYPYFESRGFPAEFVEMENLLCARDSANEVIRDGSGNPVIECMCGNVICGRTDPTKSFFTTHGSFWSNGTSRLLAGSTDSDRQARTRNRCNGEGYESVALLPLRAGEERLGLLQLNDRREGLFDPETIALWERLSDYLSVALSKARTEEVLRESEERFRKIFEHAATGIAITDVEGRFVNCNSAYVGITGYSPEELIRMSFPSLIHPDDHEPNMRLIRQLLDDEVPSFEIENRYLHRTGSVIWVHKFVSVLRDEAGKATHIIALVTDMTERKTVDSNQALMTEILRVLNRGSEDLRSSVSDTLRMIRQWTGFDAVGLRLRKDGDYPYYEQNGFPDDFVQKENLLRPRGEEGTLSCDANGLPVLECTCGLVISGRTDPAMAVFTEGGSFWTNMSSDLLALPAEDDPRVNPRNSCIYSGYQSIALVPVRSGDEIIGLLQLNDHRGGRFTLEMIRFFEVLANNIGLAIKRKQAEAELRAANQQLADADRRKDEFLAMLAHELRNPLTPVRNAIQVMNMIGPRDPVLQKNRQMVERQIGHMARLLDDLLDVSRISRGKITLQVERLDLRTVVAQAVEVAEHGIKARGLGIDYAPPSEPVWIDGDYTRLEQIAGNLLSNAIKYTDEGRIRVSLATDPIDSAGHGCAVFRVRDTGIGIPANMLPHVFDLFTQADQTLDRQRGGLGIGLTMVEHLVQMHGGTVLAHSDGPGKGCEFTVYLPLARPSCEDKSSRTQEPDCIRLEPDTGCRRALVVDDNEDAAQSMADILGLWGFQVQTSHDGPTALKRAIEYRPDVILLDIGLPGMSGFEVARQLRREPTLEHVRIIALTGYGQEEDRKMTRESGCDAHLVKPVDLNQLQDVLTQLVEA